jgi:hypothetical protein
MKSLAVLLLAWGLSSAVGQEPRAFDAGGGRAASASYSQHASLGGVGGLSIRPGKDTILRHGFVGQIQRPVGISIQAPSDQLPENGALQLTPLLDMDDGLHVAVASKSVDWTVLDGPLQEVTGEGLAMGAPVYQNTLAHAGATYLTYTNSLPLLVLDILPDNFASYASDGLPDAWQVQHFGIDNPDAAPDEDPDLDLQDNCFEYIAGLNPNQSSSRFVWWVEPVSGDGSSFRILFEPVVAGRTYVVRAAGTLPASMWNAIVPSQTHNNGNRRSVTDSVPAADRKFYQIGISLP